MSRTNAPWWRHHPPSGCPQQNPQEEPGPHQVPLFGVGDRVHLCGKPQKARRILAVEWHHHCHTFVYVVETSRGVWLSRLPYWFAEQLITEDAWQKEQAQ